MPRPATSSNASKAQAILDHAAQLKEWLNLASISGSSQQLPFPDPDLCLQSLPLSRKQVSPDERAQLHNIGVQLWNTCCSINRDDDDYVNRTDIRRNVAKARAFAYFLLESAPNSAAKSGVVPAFRNAIRAAKECLAYDHIDVAEKIIQRLAVQQDKLQDGPNGDHTATSTHRLQADFWMLRIALAWKQDRLDISEHFDARLYTLTSDQSWRVAAADLLHEIGTSLLQKRQYESAVKWLRRARGHIEAPDTEIDPMQAGELLLNILHALVRALLATNDPQHGQDALDLLTRLKQEHGLKLPVILLELELIAKDASANPDAYLSALEQMIRTVHIIDTNHRLIMHNIHRLKSLSPPHARKALRQYITTRLAPDEVHERTEAAIITFIWLAVSENGDLGNLGDDLNLIHQTWQRDLPAEAAHAGVLLLWRLIDSKLETQSYQQTAKICRLALHELFQGLGQGNREKLQRRLISCCINVNDFTTAGELYFELSETAKSNPLSNYLRYLIALRTGDGAEVDSSMVALLANTGRDQRLLLACVGETMKYGTQKQGAALLQRVLDRHGNDLPKTIDKCALLRCTARLHLSVLAESPEHATETLAMLCSIFRTAAAYTASQKEDTSLTSCSGEECEWFEKTAFNTALQYYDKWPAKYTIDLLAHSVAVCYPQPRTEPQRTKEAKHEAKVRYLQSILFTTEARACMSGKTIEDLPRTSYHARDPPLATKLQSHFYSKVLEQYHWLKHAVDQTTAKSWQGTEDLQLQTATILPLAFEAQLFLTLVDATEGLPVSVLSLEQLIDSIPHLTSATKAYALIADLILTAASQDPSEREELHLGTKLPLKHAITLLYRLITALRDREEYDIPKAARWIRCVVQLVIDSQDNTVKPEQQYTHLDMIDAITSEAVAIARSTLHTTSTATSIYTQHYPTDELQWLATTLFNLAIDLHFADGKEEAAAALHWVQRAVEIADVLAEIDLASGADQGGLARALRAQGKRVGWEL